MTRHERDRVTLALGSNKGDRLKNILSAVDLLALEGKILSEILETAAFDRDGKLDSGAAPYLNAVITGETTLTPRKFFEHTLAIEQKLGRDPSEKSLYLPRTIDIDILLFGTMTVNDPDLIIPHPRLKDRPFLQNLIDENLYRLVL